MLLSTKLVSPTLSAFVTLRPRLFALLDQAVSVSTVMVVCAPAGYGKTTLVAGWLAQQPAYAQAVTWLQLDEYDNELMRFMRYLLAALQQVAPSVGAMIQGLLQSSPMAPLPQSSEDILTVVINELAALNAPLLLVLDDLHYITDPKIIQGLRFWIEHTPANVQTILLSRDTALLPLASWKVKRQCVEIATTDLRFTPEEATLYLKSQFRLNLSADEILQLTRRTDGWIAGLQLAAMSLQGQPDQTERVRTFTGSDRHVTDYLLAEVLEKQSDDVRNFLLQTALLKRLSAPLCNALLARNDSLQQLEQLEKRNLFVVSLDTQRRWYRYHPLFAEALQARLVQMHGELVNELHRRAYYWLAEFGEPDEAIEHALAARLYPEAMSLIFTQCQLIVWQQGRPRIFLRWCDQLPETVLFTNPSLLIAIGWALLLLGKRERLARLTRSLRERWVPTGFEFADGAEIRNEVALLEAEVAVQRGDIPQVLHILAELGGGGKTLSPLTQITAYQLYGYAYRLDGDITRANEFLHNAIGLADQGNETNLWLYIYLDMAELHVIQGELTAALTVYDKINLRYPANRYPAYLPLAYVYQRLAHALCLQNRLTSAIDYVQRSLALSQQTQWLMRYPLLVSAMIHYVQGRWATVIGLIEKIRDLRSAKESAATRLFFDTAIAKLYLLHGDVTAVAGWATTFRHDTPHIPRYQLHDTHVTFARYQLAVDPSTALIILQGLRQRAEQEGWRSSLVEINILLALAYQAIHQTTQTHEYLGAALALAAPEQVMMPFLLEGASMVVLLRQSLQSNQTYRSFIGQLQAAFLPINDDTSVTVGQPLVESLTKRELAVLQRLAQGDSNPEIAKQLIMAIGTVAKHTNNIYGKLGARNRTEAVRRAQALGLL